MEAPSEAPSAAAETTENQNGESQPAPTEASSEEAPAAVVEEAAAPAVPTEEAPAPAVATEEAPAPGAAKEETPAPVVTEAAPAAPAASSGVYKPPVVGVRGRVPPGGHTSGPFW